MTDNEIIKALECCCDDCGKSCEGKHCPMIAECQTDINALEKSALALINRQKAEIERLKEEVKKEQLCNLRMTAHSVKSEAYREFAERLKEKATGKFYEERRYVDTEDIDDILEELTRNSHATCTDSNE